MKLRNVIVFTLSLLILFAIGCQREVDKSVTSLHSVDGVAVQPEPNTGAVFIGDAGDKFGTDEYVLNTVIIKDDTLKINVSYSGGCKDHQFTLIASESFLESFPVQLPIFVAHNANGDTCEAYPTEDYHFDLTPIKTMYQEAYQQEAGTIILRLKDTQNVELIYEFTI